MWRRWPLREPRLPSPQTSRPRLAGLPTPALALPLLLRPQGGGGSGRAQPLTANPEPAPLTPGSPTRHPGFAPGFELSSVCIQITVTTRRCFPGPRGSELLTRTPARPSPLSFHSSPQRQQARLTRGTGSEGHEQALREWRARTWGRTGPWPPTLRVIVRASSPAVKAVGRAMRFSVFSHRLFKWSPRGNGRVRRRDRLAGRRGREQSPHRSSRQGLSELLIRDSRLRAETPGTWPAQTCSMRTRRCAMETRKPATSRSQKSRGLR